MFRRLPNTLPKDPVFPTNLEDLGYFTTDNDQIRQIKNPEQKYQFAVNRNERVNDVYKEAMNSQLTLHSISKLSLTPSLAICRRIVDERLQKLHFQTIRLPLGTSEIEPHVPIYTSQYIERKKRVIVIFGERNQDPTIFSYRVIGDKGIKNGSVIDFVDTVLNQEPMVTASDDRPGIVIANPSQLYWYRGGGRAVSWAEWLGLPRESAVSQPFKVDPVKNTIPGNGDFREHVNYIFESALPALLHEDARLDIIGLEWTGTAVLEYLCKNCGFDNSLRKIVLTWDRAYVDGQDQWHLLWWTPAQDRRPTNPT